VSVTNPSLVPPHLLKACQAMDAHLARYVGPLAPELGREAMQSWTAPGKRLGLADLRAYARLLAAYIPDPDQCKKFEAEMTVFLKKLG
jgi:hypothetical protein